MGRYVFRLGATVRDQVAEVARYATQELQLQQIAIVAPNTPVGQLYASRFREQLAKTGATLSQDLRYAAGNEELLAQLVGELTQQPPQAIFIPDSLEEVWPLVKFFREMELKDVVLLGPAFWDDAVAIRGFGRLMEGAVYVTPFFSSSESDVVQTFVEDFKGNYHRPPDVLSAQAYDAASLLQFVVTRGSAPDVRQNLMRLDGFQGVTGALQVNEVGDVQRRMTVLRLRNGEAKEVMFAGEMVGALAGQMAVGSQ